MALTPAPQETITHNSAFNDFALWPSREVLRIDALLDDEVLAELQEIMEGHDYSWHTINQLLQAQFNKGALEFTLENGDVIFEWNNLCGEKRYWEKQKCFSVDLAEFNRDCLINLKIIPFQGGVGLEGPKLVTTNVDKPEFSAMNLCVDAGQQEILKSIESDGDHSSWDLDSEESDYEEDDEEDDEESELEHDYDEDDE